jgi:hypothetical protein
MVECRECGKQMPEGSNFCPHCGAPQHERAAKALESYMKRRIRELSQQELEEIRVGGTGDQLWSRVSYAVGWATIVVGLAMLPAIASGFVLFGGLITLPPIRRAIGRAVGGTPGVRPAALLYLTSVGIGVALFLVA